MRTERGGGIITDLMKRKDRARDAREKTADARRGEFVERGTYARRLRGFFVFTNGKQAQTQTRTQHRVRRAQRDERDTEREIVTR